MNDLFLFQISIITLSNESFNIIIIIHLTEIKQIFDCFLKINSFIIGIKKIKNQVNLNCIFLLTTFTLSQINSLIIIK